MPNPLEQAAPEIARIPFRGDELKLTAGDPAEAWAEGGTLHMRRVPFENKFVGTYGDEACVLLTPIVGNLSVDEKTGDGWIWGTYKYVADGDQYRWGDRIGVFDLTFWGRTESGTAKVEFVGVGSGDFTGMLMLGSLVSPEDEPAPVDAMIYAFGAQP